MVVCVVWKKLFGRLKKVKLCSSLNRMGKRQSHTRERGRGGKGGTDETEGTYGKRGIWRKRGKSPKLAYKHAQTNNMARRKTHVRTRARNSQRQPSPGNKTVVENVRETMAKQKATQEKTPTTGWQAGTCAQT
jgi:hypothetical protein